MIPSLYSHYVKASTLFLSKAKWNRAVVAEVLTFEFLVESTCLNQPKSRCSLPYMSVLQTYLVFCYQNKSLAMTNYFRDRLSNFPESLWLTNKMFSKNLDRH